MGSSQGGGVWIRDLGSMFFTIITRVTFHFKTLNYTMRNPAFMILVVSNALILLRISAACSNSAKTVYIRPANSSETNCPFLIPRNDAANVQDCFTLDDFTKNELPHLKRPVNLTLTFLNGVHRPTASIEFIDVQQLVMRGISSESLPLVQLAGHINISSTAFGSPLCLEINNLEIDGNSDYALIVNTMENVTVSVNQVRMCYTVLQILNDMFGCPFVDISTTMFIASIIEIHDCSFLGRTDITNSVFWISDKQPYTIAVCMPFLLSHRKQSYGYVPFANKMKQLQLDNVTLLDLNQDSKSMIHFPLLCYNSSENKPTDIYVRSGLNVSITRSQFSRGYGGMAICPKSSKSGHSMSFEMTILNSTITGYTQGVFVLNDEFTNVMIRLIHTTVAKNSISTGGNIAAGLTIITEESFDDNDLTIELENCTFQHNIDTVGNLQIIKLHGVYTININNTMFVNNVGTVIEAKESNITFSGHVIFEGNSAWQGGALSLTYATMTVNDHTTVDFGNNNVTEFGGAIFVDDPLFYLQNDKGTIRSCFYQPSHSHFSFENARVNFYDNFARKGGYDVYGTSIRNYCKVQMLQKEEGIQSHLFFFSGNSNSYSSVSSKMTRVCLCKGGEPRCNDTSFIFSEYNREVYPGEVFSISAVAVGAEFGTTVGYIYAKLLNTSSSIQKTFNQFVSPHCTQMNYLIHSNNSQEIVYLTSDNITLKYYGDTSDIARAISSYNANDVVPYSLLTTPVFINVTIKKCPAGLTLRNDQLYCDCYPELISQNIICTVEHGKGYVYRKALNWIGVQADKTNGVIFNTRCPFDHCSQDEVRVNLDTSDGSDSQCTFDHSGTLCGGCKQGYSVAIGSSHCLNCTNDNNVALVLFFAAAGPLLYIFIAVLDLTIAKGQINGLIFYANIVWVYQSIVFTSFSDADQITAYVLKIIIAWLNLDFGIETCFINGLDAFYKFTLQYIFPIYIWFIALLVKIVYDRISVQHFEAHYPLITKTIGKPVDVLTTSIFLSYTKLLRTIVAGFSWAVLYHYPQNTTEIVWAVDGSVSYLRHKHILVFIMASLALIVTLSYTIYILWGGLQNVVCLHVCQKHLNRPRRLPSWCWHLIDMPLPLRDSHFLPLKNKHRYWFGLLLLIRIILLVVFSATNMIYPKSNLLILVIVATLLLLYMGWKKVFRTEYVWLLEGMSLGNLIFLSSGILYIQHPVIVFVSIGIALIQLMGIIGYQLVRFCVRKQNTATSNSLPTDANDGVNLEPESIQESQGESTREFREPLLHDEDENDERVPFIHTCNLPADPSMFQCLHCCKEQT